MSRWNLGRIESRNGSSTGSSGAGSKRGQAKLPGHKDAGQVLSIRGRKYPRKETLESILGTVLRLEDNGLDEILRALSDLANIVRSKKFDSVAADEALRRAAVWAVEKSLLDREVRSLAITDDLTVFFNRRGFLAAAAQQLKLAQRDRLNVLLFFCDLDDLKGINDSFGHREGDLALVRTADALEETFRDFGLAGEIRGDEFAVLAWEASLPDVRTILSRLSKNLENANEDAPQYKLSLSAGVARYDPQEPLPLGELMAQADEEMYKQKRRRQARAAVCGK